MGRFTDNFNQRLHITDKTHYRREQYQSFLTTPEWRNVEMAEEFAAFLKEGKSMFQFPYFRQVAELWKILYQSYAAARKYNSFSQIFFSEYILMNLFVVIFTTFEFIPKGIISLLLYPFLKKENHTEMQKKLAASYQQYAEQLQTVPFYDHHYKNIREDLAEKYQETAPHTWVDWFSWTCLSIELRVKYWISKPLSYWFNQDDNKAPATTDILVKCDIQDDGCPEAAKEKFKAKLPNTTQIINNHLYVKRKTEDKHHTSIYARLQVPRYKAFVDTIQELANQNIHIRTIAGQERIQVKMLVDGHDQMHMTTQIQGLNSTEQKHTLYTYQDHIHPYRKFCLFDAPVRNLHETLNQLKTQENVRVEFVHNF